MDGRSALCPEAAETSRARPNPFSLWVPQRYPGCAGGQTWLGVEFSCARRARVAASARDLDREASRHELLAEAALSNLPHKPAEEGIPRVQHPSECSHTGYLLIEERGGAGKG